MTPLAGVEAAAGPPALGRRVPRRQAAVKPLDFPVDWKVYAEPRTTSMAAPSLRIGELALRAGLNPRTLRYYEAVGLLTAPFREANSYRRYPAETLDLLAFIKQAQGLGFTLDEIREILTIRRRGEVPCSHVRSLLQAKVAELDRKLADLLALRARIRRSLAAWGRRPRLKATVCPHIEAGARSAPSASRARRRLRS
jgi:DNA-binding transcriptional MerR regulator